MADKALDDTVMANLQSKRNSRRPFRDQRTGVGSGTFRGGHMRSQGYGGGQVGKSRMQNNSYNSHQQQQQHDAGPQPAKVLLSNLDFNVTEEDVRELFCEFGKTRRLTMNYDKSGRSLGTAEILYEDRQNAYRAMQQYNGVPLDGKPMIIEVMSGGAGRMGGRVGGGMRNNFGTSRPVPYGGRFQGQQRQYNNRQNNQPQQRRNTTIGHDDKIEKTAADLDAELDKYNQEQAAKAAAEEKEILGDDADE